MPKPHNYDDLTDSAKWDLCLTLLQSARGQYLLDRAFDLGGESIQQARRLFPESVASDEALLFKMAIACEALEVAIGFLTLQPEPESLDIQDMEILYDGLRIQMRLAASDEQDPEV
jgi:hypothetical protein